MALRNVIMPDGHIIRNVPEDVTDDEVVAKYSNKKLAEEEIPKAFEAPTEEPEIEQQAEPSFAKDYARTITRTGASIANIPMELIRAGREAVGLDTEVADLYQRRVTEAVAKDVSGGISEVPVKQIITSEGKVKTPETVGGMVFSAAPYLVGGAATMSTKLVKALPRLVQGIASGVAVDQILYDGEDNLANVLDDAGLAEAEGIAKDLIDFFAVEKDDGTLERRAKLIAEGVVLGGAFEVILGGTGAAIKAAKAKFGKNITDLNTDEKSELIVDYLKEARETVEYRATPQPVDYSETAEGVAQVAQQNSSGVKRFMQQIFTSRGYFTPKAYNAFNDAQYAQRQVVAQAESISNRLQKAIRTIGDDVDSPELVDRINRALVGEELDVPLPENIAKEVEQARDLIDEMSGRIINSSIPNDEFREVIAENVGSYIRRSYRLFEDTGYKPSANIRSNAQDYIANVILSKKKDISFEDAFEEAEDVVASILGETKNQEKAFEYFEGLRRVNTEILQGRKDIPEPIRKLMGEITEPAENIVLTVSKMARLVETNKFFEAVDRLGTGNYIFDSGRSRNGVDYTVEITGTNSVLDGKFTTPEIFTALQEKESMLMDGISGPLAALYRNFLTLKGGAQLVKTVYSHVTHLRNILGGAQFGMANGTNPFGKEGMRTLSALKNRISQGGDEALDEMYQKYLRLGIINTNVRVNEFRALLDTGFETTTDTFARKVSERLQGYGLSAQAQKLPEEIYMAVDDFYKITNFEYELDVLKKAFPDEPLEVLEARAADIVQNTFPNYDRVPKGIKAVRYLPVGNFVSFPTEIWRTSANILKQASAEINSGNEVLKARGIRRMAGYGATLVGWGAIAEGSAQLAGLTPDEAEAAQYLSETPWSRAPRNFVRIDGKLYANDTQFINSYSAVSTPFINAYKAIQDGSLRGESLDRVLGDAIFEASSALLAPYIEESIFTKAVMDVGIAYKADDGRTPEGKQLFAPGLFKTEKAINAFEHLALAFEPGSIKSLRDLAGSALEVPNRNTGQPKDLRAELFTNLTGIRFTEMRPEDALMYSVKDYNYKSQNIVRPQAKYGREASEVETRYDQRQRQLYEYQQDLYAKYAAAEQLMGRGAAVKVLLDSGLSENQVGFLVANMFRPEQPSEKLMLDMYEKLPEEEKRKNSDAISAMWRRYAQYSRTKLIRPVEEPKVDRQRRAKGGEVFVPQAPSEPDERIDKMTGLPYNIQAGSAFIDEEDPEKRMMADGGLVHPENKKFFEDFHNRVVSEGRELVEDDKTTTMRILGVGIGGKEYLIPSYDPDTKRVLSMDEAVEKYMPLIKEGKLKGYDTPQQAEADRRMFYPDIVGRTRKAQGGIAQMLGIDPEDLEWAKSLGKKYGEAEELDGRGDAARHLALGWLAKKSNYPSLTKFAINAREVLELDFKGGPMDVENNKRGFNLPAADRQEAEQQIMDMISSGDATFFTPQESRQRRGYVEGGGVEEEEDGFFDALSSAITEKLFGNSNIREEFRGVASMANIPGGFNPQTEGEVKFVEPVETAAKATGEYIQGVGEDLESEFERNKGLSESGEISDTERYFNNTMAVVGTPAKLAQDFSEGVMFPYMDDKWEEFKEKRNQTNELYEKGEITEAERGARLAAADISLVTAPVADLIGGVAEYIPYLDEAAQAISETEAVQGLATWAKENPRSAENILAIVEILGVVPAFKVIERGVNRTASSVDTNITGFYGATATALNKILLAGEAFGKRIPGAVVEALGPGYSAVRRTTGLSPAKISTAVKALAKKSKHKVGDALAEILTGRYIGLQSREKTGLIHDRNPLVMVHEYGYDDAFDDASFKRNVFASIEEGGNVGKAVPTKVQEDAVEHLFKAWEVKKPDETFIVYKRPDGPQNLGDEVFSSSYEQGAKKLKFLLTPAKKGKGGAQKKMLTFYNQQRKKNGQEPVDSIDSMPPEVLKAYLKKEKVDFVEGPDDFIYIKESYVSGAKEIGGVNVFSAVNTRTGDVFSMVSDKHDIFKDIDPIRGRSLLTVQPMISKNFKTGLIGGFKRRDFVAEAQEAKNLFQEVYNLAVQRGGKKAGDAFEEKYFKGMNKELDKIINKDPTKYETALNDVVPATIKILEYIKDNPEILAQDYKDVARRAATSAAAVPFFVGNQED
jgi:hypothetical protein